MVGRGAAYRFYRCVERWIALAAPAMILIAMAAGFGCAKGDPPVEISEPFEVLDLVAGFPNAAASRIETDIGEGPKAPMPYVNPERGVLFVPLGAAVEYELELPPRGVLRSNDARNLGSATGRLEVSWVPVEGAETLLTRDLSAAPGRLACIGNTNSERGRLVMRARGRADDDDPRAGMRIFDPKVIAGVACEPRRSVDPLQGEDRRPNIVVYLIDALRADRLGCYGDDRGLTPHIDEFASSSLVFSGAQAQTSWTRPAVASIFTGLLPQQHRAIDKSDVLPDQATTLAEVLSAAGYQTAAVISNGNVARAFGFEQGFDYFKRFEQVTIGREVVRSEDLNQAVFSWLDQERDSTPFFLYVHTVDPHLPYDPPPLFRQRFAPGIEDPEIGSVAMVNDLASHSERVTPELIDQLSDLYDAEVAANDLSFGDLIAGLDERGLTDSTVVVMLSDHGEEFFDHRGWTHGNTLFAEVLDVPLVIRIPGTRPGKVEEIVQHVDLFPTLLEFANLSAPVGVFGRSAVPLWTGAPGEPWINRGVSHLDIRGRFAEAWTDPEWKLHVRRRIDGTLKVSLFDRQTDPTERADAAFENPDTVEELRLRYTSTVEGAGARLTDTEIEAEREAQIEAQLKALGYL